MSTPDLDDLKKIEFDMFLKFKNICEKHKFQYFLIGGTCLGAVRHLGFIPWDDDIDVGMPRIDYEKFLKVAQNELPKYIFVQTGKTDINYPMNYAKLRNSNTTFIESSAKKFKMNHGVYLDIFPLDGYKYNKIHSLLIKGYSLRIAQEFYSNVNSKTGIIQTIKNSIIRLFFCRDYRKARDRKDSLMKKYSFEDMNMVFNYCGAYGEKEIMPKEYFGIGSKGVFEGVEVVLPEKYDLYLKKQYDDYMKLPPIEERIGHHFCEVIDLHKSYKCYIE